MLLILLPIAYVVTYALLILLLYAITYTISCAVAYHNQNTQPLKTESLFSLVYTDAGSSYPKSLW